MQILSLTLTFNSAVFVFDVAVECCFSRHIAADLFDGNYVSFYVTGHHQAVRQRGLVWRWPRMIQDGIESFGFGELVETLDLARDQLQYFRAFSAEHSAAPRLSLGYRVSALGFRGSGMRLRLREVSGEVRV